MNWLVLALALLLVGLLVLYLASRQQRRTGLPPGRVIYDDSRRGGKLEEPLYDSQYDLVGKPDYILEEDGVQIPVEVKSTLAPAQPYDGHVLQLAAYCLLVHRTRGVRPSHGILRYRNRSFAIDYTPELEARLISALEEIRSIRQESVKKRYGGPERSHHSSARCARCGYRSVCNQALGSE
jgi:CRISPR-associated exonuclease Cas4